MKKSLNKPYCWIFGGIVLLITIGAIFLYSVGFRITYAPELENSWDAISACASWFGVITSCAAVLCAIFIPIRIANRQDKIALFEKKYECYSNIIDIINFPDLLKKANNTKEIKITFASWLTPYEPLNSEYLIYKINTAFDKIQNIIIAGQFLFPNYNYQLLKRIVYTIIQFYSHAINESFNNINKPITEEERKMIKDLSDLCQKFKDECFNSMKKELDLRVKRSRILKENKDDSPFS